MGRDPARDLCDGIRTIYSGPRETLAAMPDEASLEARICALEATVAAQEAILTALLSYSRSQAAIGALIGRLGDDR